jgi:hypothetical protein
MDLTVRTQSWVGRSYTWLASAFGTQTCRSVTLDLDTFDFTNVVTNGIIPAGTVLGKVTVSGKYGPYDDAGTSEVQTLSVTGTPTGGDFTLTYDGQTTAAIAFDATAAAVQAALEALSNIDAGEVVCAGGPLDTDVTITFAGDLQGTNVSLIVADGTGLTGGSSPDAAVAETTPGVAGSTDGRGTAVGILFEDVDCNEAINLAGTRDITGERIVPMMWQGAINESLLPTGHGLDANAKTDLPHFKFF